MNPPRVRGSLADRILRYLSRYPGQEFRCYEIARDIKRDTQPTANECGRLARRGFIDRTGSDDRTKPTLYRAKS